MRHAAERNKYFILLILFLAFLPFKAKAFTIGQDLVEWELRVIGLKADIRLEPDINSTVIMTVPQSSILRSYEQEGEWFRVIFQHENGIVVIGYVHSTQVKIIKEEVEKKVNFWGDESDFYEGIGLTIKVFTGFNHIAAGQINEGMRGVVDYHRTLLSNYGHYFLGEIEPFHSGFDYGVDAIYSLTSRIGIGIGTGYIFWGNKSYIPLNNLVETRRIENVPKVKAYPIRLGAFVSIPIFKKINVAFNGGPAYYFAHYNYNMFFIRPYTVAQRVNGRGWGFDGGIGLELEWNSRATLFIEVRGRHAKISTFKGTEKRLGYTYEGPLCFLEFGEGSEIKGQLWVLNEEMLIYPNVKKAEFDLSGYAINVGAKVKF
ncbi:MAG: hypothetical protein JW755_10650 [Candidatus Aminicenantes bacterium]|nr:hypothetical protein [Candidatus Aminicenantes bacterium]